MKKLNFMSQVKLTGAMTLLACLFFLAGAANATMLYDNLGSTSTKFDPLAGWNDNGNVIVPPLFDSFSTGAAGFNLLDVQLRLQGSPSSGSLSVDLYSDSSNSPGALLFHIGNLNDNFLPSTWAAVDFLLASPYKLAADTRYWLELNSINSSTAEWSWSLDQKAVGVAGESYGFKTLVGPNTFKTWVFPNTDGPYQMRLSDTPLPGAVWLLGSGLVGLGLWRGRKLFKA